MDKAGASLTEHQRSAAWEQIWYSKNGYYDPLDGTVRNKLEALLLDVLDQEREKVYGISLPPRDTTEVPKPAPVPPAPVPGLEIRDLHDPALYFFDQRKLWIPWALDMKSGTKRGTRSKRYPEGAVVHWTAGHRNGIKAGADYQAASGMSYMLIDKDGAVGQGDPLDKWGYHAGESSYPGLSGTVSDELVGIEVQAAGTLKEHQGHYYPWWDQGANGVHRYLPSNRIPPEEVVTATARANVAAGHYHRFTDAQYVALRRTLCWLHLNWPSVFQIRFILGHDEVSPRRKTDPGGAIAPLGKVQTMPEFRDVIAEDVRMILKNR